MSDRSSLPIQPVRLDDAHTLAWCVNEDGSTWPWLITDLCTAHAATARHGCNCPACAPHEQTGPLPPPVVYRLRQPPRCGGRTTTGYPCRIEVRAAGQRCHWHRADQSAATS